MKTRLLILILLLSPWMCHAQGDEAVPAESPAASGANDSPNGAIGGQSTLTPTPQDATTPPREGDTIWLEEKIAPPTRWIENLVKPLTTWMERKVQHPVSSAEETALDPWVRPELPATIHSETPEARILTPAEAGDIARRAAHGEVLRVKLISASSKEPIYRVKLISGHGEIQILHVNGHTGALVLPAKPPVSNPSD